MSTKRTLLYSDQGDFVSIYEETLEAPINQKPLRHPVYVVAERSNGDEIKLKFPNLMSEIICEALDLYAEKQKRGS